MIEREKRQEEDADMGSGASSFDPSVYTDTVERLPSQPIRLVITAGAHDGTRLQVHPEKQEICIGRSKQETHLALTESQSVSSKHANISYDNSKCKFTVTDLGTTNGTYVVYKGSNAEERLPRLQPTAVPDYAVLLIGHVPVALFSSSFDRLALFCAQGEKQGKWFPISSTITGIGRSGTNVLRLTNPRVSAEHCQIVKRDGIWTIEDLDSKAGTKLNEMALKKNNTYYLFPGALIKIADNEIFTVYVKPKKQSSKT